MTHEQTNQLNVASVDARRVVAGIKKAKRLKKISRFSAMMLLVFLFSAVTFAGKDGVIVSTNLGVGGDVFRVRENDLFLDNEQTLRTPNLLSYVVKDGDTVADVARKFNITEETIRASNNLPNGKLFVDDSLRILPVSGVLHVVSEGESVKKIAKMYEVGVVEIQKQNSLKDDENVNVGQVLVIPGGKSLDTAKYFARNNSGKRGELLFPTQGVYTQYYHYGHNGVDIASRTSPDVFAAKGGKVNWVRTKGWNYGYGRHIVIDHGDGTLTRYAHLDESFVKEGDEVEAGELIGRMGTTGHSSGIHLHFEYIVNGVKVNPVIYF